MPVTILVTGFGPFPGAPFNPTGPLAQRLARLRRPALADVKIVAHVFQTGYAAVDRELPRLLAKHKPHALLMFGLAPRAKALRVERRARNAISLLADATGAARLGHAIAPGGPPAIALPAPTQHLLSAARAARVPAVASHNAGRYLCNYLCWRGAEAAAASGGPRLAAFIHVPPIRGKARPRRAKSQLTGADLFRAGTYLLITLAAAARR